MAYYADRVTKKLLRFEYNLDKGELGESTMVADFSEFPGKMIFSALMCSPSTTKYKLVQKKGLFC